MMTLTSTTVQNFDTEIALDYKSDLVSVRSCEMILPGP
jgi:hypothetical protein